MRAFAITADKDDKLSSEMSGVWSRNLDVNETIIVHMTKPNLQDET